MDKTSYKQRVDKICFKGKGKGGKFSYKDFLKIRNRIVEIGDERLWHCEKLWSVIDGYVKASNTRF